MTPSRRPFPTNCSHLDGHTAPEGIFNPAGITSITRATTSLISDSRGFLHPERQNSQGTDVNRGRSVQRMSHVDNPLARAQSRSSRDIATIEVNVRNIEARHRHRSTFLSAFLENPTDPLADFEDYILEPCPEDLVCHSVSDVIWQRAPTFTESSASVNRMESHAEYLELRSSVKLRPSIAPSASCRLPQEIVRQIFNHLAPADFNSARHACRLWYVSSLERHMLETMLRRGGWSRSAQHILASDHNAGSQVRANAEWLMSKRIARECALGPDWTGNGCAPVGGKPYWGQNHQSINMTSFIHTSTTDFNEFGVHYPCAEDGNSGMTFTVSTCGKFLMLATGCLVCIYELNRSDKGDDEDGIRNNGALRPITSVICPRRVLACSMDTSSHRYAIAVLMDGRMGLVCDLTSLSNRHQDHIPSQDQLEYMKAQCTAPNYRGGDYRNRISIKSSQMFGHCLPVGDQSQRFTFPVIAAAGSHDLTPSGDCQRQAWQNWPHNDMPESSARFAEASYNSHAKPKNVDKRTKGKNRHVAQMPIEQSVPTMYAPLCNADDPPRSVALCPQRRCVAFGCSSGIELHWVDALTGQDLNRWFPLTAPSDYLFFLPPRAGVDSAKKLRLISSAGKPQERPVVAEKFGSGSVSSTIKRSTSTPFWATLSGRNPGSWASLGAREDDAPCASSRDNSDHYRAIPLCDGYHILFIDPMTGLLCLGSDAPIGGPTKLLRKIWFSGPAGYSTPISYAGASGMQDGVRVVASYGSDSEQSIWLFSVPADVFADDMTDHGNAELPLVRNSLKLESENREWLKWWSSGRPHDWVDSIHGAARGSTLNKDKLWPVQVRGQEIGKCHGLTDLALDSGPEMTIWAFARTGLAKTWQIDDGTIGDIMRKRVISRSGTVREGDADDDMNMSESPLPTAKTGLSGETSYDGTASVLVSGHLAGNVEPELFSRSAFIDGDGDTIMTEDYDLETDYESDDSLEAVALAQDRYETIHQHNRFEGRLYGEQIRLDGLRLLEEGGGISRIDIDIR